MLFISSIENLHSLFTHRYYIVCNGLRARITMGAPTLCSKSKRGDPEGQVIAVDVPQLFMLHVFKRKFYEGILR